MRKKITFFLFVLVFTATLTTHAQSYSDSIATWRKDYIKDLLAEPRQPVKSSQLGGIYFFKPDPTYRVWATFTETPGSVPFMIQTHSGKKKPFRQYGTLTFTIHDTVLTLQVYQILDLIHDQAHKDDLFVPFNDMSNYETTFAGGRYIDLSVADIHDGQILLDFNKCYNPYCAYADGFSCPVPPYENRLPISINAGEMTFQP